MQLSNGLASRTLLRILVINPHRCCNSSNYGLSFPRTHQRALLGLVARVKPGLQSTLACCLIHFGIDSLGFESQQGRVAFLDFESQPEDFQRRLWLVKQGLNITSDESFQYRHYAEPLAQRKDDIHRLISNNKIDCLIVDSATAPVGYDDEIGAITAYYNTLRGFNITALSTGLYQPGLARSPFGNLAVFNRNRSLWELIRNGNNLTLKHIKNNEGILLEDIQLNITFGEEMISFG